MYKNQNKIHIAWSASFAYAIGLITSDGNLHKDGRHIGFISKDLELVEKFKQSLSLQNRIGKAARGGETEKKYFYVRFGDKVFYEFLNSIGLTPAKSKTIQSVAIPDEYFADFVRGVFDGDGSFYTFWDKRWPNSFAYQVSFSSASKTFITWLKTKLDTLYGINGFNHEGAGVSEIRYLKGDSVTLFNQMYYARDLLFLNRKYVKMNNAIRFNTLLKVRSESYTAFRLTQVMPG